MSRMVTFAPVPRGTQWQVLMDKTGITAYRITVEHADLDVEHDPNDLTALEQAVRARALDLVAAGEATVIGEIHELDVTNWEMEGSGRASEALQSQIQFFSGEGAR